MDSPIPAATHGMSINVYGRGDAAFGDSPSHMGIAVYEIGSITCEMHHIRNPNDTDFIYDPRTQPLEDPVLRGRCEIATFSKDQKERAIRLLSAFGQDESNIPEFGIGNCQDWVAAAALMLEQAGILKQGEGAFWKSMINSSADEIRDSCLQTGREWIAGPELTFEGEPDARFNDKATVEVGKLAQNPLFQTRMQSLLDGHQQGQESNSQDPPERPFYVSSPFFSRTNMEG